MLHKQLNHASKIDIYVLCFSTIYANENLKTCLRVQKVKAYTILITDSVREGKYYRDNQSIRVQRQENAEVWLPELIGTS